jgi:hypothetical protein
MSTRTQQIGLSDKWGKLEKLLLKILVMFVNILSICSSKNELMRLRMNEDLFKSY